MLSYAGLLIVLVAMESRLVFPGAYMEDDHRAVAKPNAAIEAIRYMASDGVEAGGRLFEKEGPTNYVLFLHGNGTKVAWLDDWMRRLSHELDATVLAAEFRGFADDSNTPNETGLIADCFGARDFFCRRYDLTPNQIILYGQSLGGGCATALAVDGGAKVLILERTFDRLVDIAAEMYPFIPTRLIMRNRFDSVARIANYHGPLIQIHGDTDRLIPIENARNLFDSSASQNKTWIEMDGVGHNDTLPRSTMKQVAGLVEAINAGSSNAGS
ncbi:alpha/beta hydrolase [Novipirellula herctigrandis]|uniref:alpha/beta hydrolase n=1 Tax=Novipirellula herctigrandis TaxID=2527986 RepID=UPI003AF351DB